MRHFAFGLIPEGIRSTRSGEDAHDCGAYPEQRRHGLMQDQGIDATASSSPFRCRTAE
jgi:hypothetical protein